MRCQTRPPSAIFARRVASGSPSYSRVTLGPVAMISPISPGARALGTGLWKGGDQTIIDGLLVNGSWKVVGVISSVVRKVQSGYLYHYAFAMIMGVLVLMTYFVWLK